jgi:hypothetical protein
MGSNARRREWTRQIAGGREVITYQVKNWNTHFENNKSRERDECSFVCVPNQQSGLGFSRIMDEKDGAAIYGVFCMILGACSRQKKPREGWLTQDGHPTGTAWALDDLAIQFRRPEREIRRALDILSSPKVGWLARVEISEDGQLMSGACEVPAECPPTALERKKERIEEKEDDALWRTHLQESEAYSHVAIEAEFQKAVFWCGQKRRKLTRAFFLRWINKIEKPMNPVTQRAPELQTFRAERK